MVRQPSDTDPDAAWRMVELPRQAPPARRAALALSLSKAAVERARRALARRMPGRSALEAATVSSPGCQKQNAPDPRRSRHLKPLSSSRSPQSFTFSREKQP